MIIALGYVFILDRAISYNILIVGWRLKQTLEQLSFFRVFCLVDLSLGKLPLLDLFHVEVVLLLLGHNLLVGPHATEIFAATVFAFVDMRRSLCELFMLLNQVIDRLDLATLALLGVSDSQHCFSHSVHDAVTVAVML